MDGGWAPRGVRAGSIYPVTRPHIAPAQERRQHRRGTRRCGHALLPWSPGGPCVASNDVEPTRAARDHAEPKVGTVGGLSAQGQVYETGVAGGAPVAHSRSADIG